MPEAFLLRHIREADPADLRGYLARGGYEGLRKALAMPPAYYRDLASAYQVRRDRLMAILGDAGFTCYEPRGAYYIMTDIAAFGFPDDVAFARHLVTDVGVAAVPGSSFYRDPATGRTKLRFCFCKKDETLDEGARRLGMLVTKAEGKRQKAKGS